jgi:transcriptional regulator with XRE-family HTH domain
LKPSKKNFPSPKSAQEEGFQAPSDGSLRTKKETNWTADSADAFAHKLAFDFVTQVSERINSSGITQTELANRLGISEGAVSQFLNTPNNLTLKTIAKYSQALGMKAAIIAYDDGDRENVNGLISSTVFRQCWIAAGAPTDLWAWQGVVHSTTPNTLTICAFVLIGQTVTSGSSFLMGAEMYFAKPATARIQSDYRPVGLLPGNNTAMTLEVGI